WGWSLSTSYIAATEHFFTGHGSPTPAPYNPWTPSLVMEGVNQDLVLNSNNYWHSANETYTRVQYYSADDHWEAWGKNGTHYVFNMGARINDPSPSANGYLTYKWMLASATDVHGNVINYTYRYENGSGSLQPTPIAGNNNTRAVYPYQIGYGLGADRLQVSFEIVSRTDISSNDINNHIYQSYRIDKIDVSRKQEVNGTYALLRSYHLTQNYSIVLQDTSPTPSPYPHLTLTGITEYGNNGTSYLPSMTFSYILRDGTCSAYGGTQYDWGHLCQARNGYGG